MKWYKIDPPCRVWHIPDWYDIHTHILNKKSGLNETVKHDIILPWYFSESMIDPSINVIWGSRWYYVLLSDIPNISGFIILRKHVSEVSI